jgi:hypothetical protein
MSLIRDFVSKLRDRRAHPDIPTPWGNVTESARRQCALNCLVDPVKFAQVEMALSRQTGLTGDALRQEMRRRYPESFPKG